MGEDEDYDSSKPYHDKQIVVPILDDDLVESDEYFFGQIRRTSSLDKLPETLARATILNDDFKSFYSLEAVEPTVEEGENFVLKIKRNIATKSAKIDLFVRGNTSELGEDFCILNSNDMCLGGNPDASGEEKKYPVVSVDFGV